MKMAIATLGSRGDVQPYLALAVALQRAGHSVRLASNEPFRPLAAAYDIEFVSLAGDIKEIVGEEGRAEIMAAENRPLKSLRGLQKYLGPMVREALSRLPSALAGCEVVIGQMLVPGASDYAEHHRLPFFDAEYDPIVPTRAFAHPGAPPHIRPGLMSRLTYFAAEQVFWQAFRSEVNSFRRQALGLGRAPLLGPSRLSPRRRPPTLMGYSSALVPRPSDWPAHMVVTGAWTLDAPTAYKPAPALVDFLAAGEAPIYVGFGSMAVDHPEKLARNVIDGLRRAKKRGVLSTGYGAMAGIGGDDMLFVGDVPHAWLFPRMSAVVHHGGPGTTAAALHAGVPQFIVPFLSDQPFWGHRVAASGVGPPPVAIARFSADDLTAAVLRTDEPAMRKKAAELGRVARAEAGADGAVAAIHQFLERRAA